MHRRGFAVALGCGALFPAFAFADVPAFDPHDYRKYRLRGSHVVAGRLAVLLPDGTTLAKTGSPVVLLPDSPLTRWWLTTSARDINARPAGQSPDDVTVPDSLRPFARYTTCDADGRFEFDDLPTGHYLTRGHLSVGLPRAVVATAPPVADPYDAPLAAGTRRIVFDYSYVWLDSAVLAVGSGPPPDVAFHLVARRDQVAR